MPKVSVYNIEGKKVSDLDLKEEIFGIEPNEAVIHSVLVNYQANQRQGTQSTKTRSEVSGGGRKPWKQKGTGRARAGSTRSPLFAGGGVIFGPKPRSFEINMPQKARKLALKSALSAREEQLVIVKDFSAITEPKTKLMAGIIKSLNLSGKILVIADTLAEENKNLSLAAGNIPSVKLLLPSNLNVKDLLEADFVVMTEKAVNDITERLQ
jgi:large subunit ribosomal protein L4